MFRVHILLSPVNYYNLYIYHLESSIFLSLLFRWSYGLFFHLFCLAHLFFPASLRLFISFLFPGVSYRLIFYHNHQVGFRFIMPDCFPCVCSPLLAVFSHRLIFYANTLVSITPGLALLALPSLFQFFSFPVPPSLSAYLSCSLLFSTDSSFIATIRLAFVSSCPIVSLASALHFLPFSPTGSYFMPTL